MFALKRLILERLQISLKELELDLGTIGVTDGSIVQGGLKQVDDTAEIKYSSAIALQQARFLDQPIAEISSRIQLLLQESNANVLETILRDGSALIWQEIEIFLVNEIWLYFRVKPQGVIAWFHTQTQQWANKFPQASQKDDFLSGGAGCWGDALVQQDLFELQYSYARCCSVLRLGESLGLVWPAEEGASALSLGGRDLGDAWITQGVLQHPAERTLLWQLIHITDRLSLAEWKRPTDLGQEAIALSQAFLAFYGAVRVVEAVKGDQRAIAEARLGLVWLTRQILGYLLEFPFASVAPDSL